MKLMERKNLKKKIATSWHQWPSLLESTLEMTLPVNQGVEQTIIIKKNKQTNKQAMKDYNEGVGINRLRTNLLVD